MKLQLPDDVEIEVPMEHMVVKDSVFIPTLQVDATRTLVWEAAKIAEIGIKTKTAVVDGYLGLLIWRIS